MIKITNKEKTKICQRMAERLRELRDSKGISRDSFRESLIKERYPLSPDSIKFYEENNPDNSKFGSCINMKVNTLIEYCRFYGTSADYILCLSDYKNPNVSVQGACEITGLSEKAVELLHFSSTCDKENTNAWEIVNCINVMLEKIYDENQEGFTAPADSLDYPVTDSLFNDLWQYMNTDRIKCTEADKRKNLHFTDTSDGTVILPAVKLYKQHLLNKMLRYIESFDRKGADKNPNK